MSNIVTFLTFRNRAEDAAAFYTSIFKDSKILSTVNYPDVAQASSRVMVVEIELQGRHYILLNGGDHFKFTDGISLCVLCDSQQEIDTYWSALTAGGGEPGPCGWLKDKFGVSWQVCPRNMERFWTGTPEQSKRVFETMTKMSKLDLAALEAAAKG
jgi:predicted 3-demethylubiquinone-9 3-methyltransferase (glyoxalase superfamily)